MSAGFFVFRKSPIGLSAFKIARSAIGAFFRLYISFFSDSGFYTAVLISFGDTMRRFAALLSLLPALASAVSSTPEQIVSRMWQSMSHAPGVTADTVSRIFHPEAVVFGGRYQEGQARFSAMRAQDFVAAQARARPNGFYECELVREVKTYDRFATVYSVVESRTDKSAAKADFVGVNSIHLYDTGDGWQVISLYYHVEKNGQPIPLEGGTSGVCLNRY